VLSAEQTADCYREVHVMGPDHTDELNADATVQVVQQINRIITRNKTARRDYLGTDVRPGRCWLSKRKKLKLRLSCFVTLNVRKNFQGN
jgi:hypothetical protein